MTLAQLRQGALLRFGKNPYEGEDPVLIRPLLTDLINEAHRWLAVEARLYRQTFTTNLVISSGGISTVSLDETVYLIDDASVRVLNGSTWEKPEQVPESVVTDYFGPFDAVETVTVPTYYWMATGSADSAQRQLVFYPGATAAISNGLKYSAWTYPAAMTAETDRPEFPASEHDLLLPVICWKMAEVLLSQGEQTPLAYWQGAANVAALDLRERMADHRRGTDVRRIRCVEEY